MPISKWVDQKTVVHLHNGILRSRKKEEAATLCDSMDGTGEHYSKWNKPGGERQIPYNLTYKWNLVNKTNKQAKYNQRHWNKELTLTRGKGEGGKKRKVSQGTCIQDLWTKPKQGRSEGGVGESGGREMETTVLKRQLKKKKKSSVIQSGVRLYPYSNFFPKC